MSWVLYTKFKFGWGPGQVGWSLFAVGLVSAFSQGVLLKPLLARFSPQQLAITGLLVASATYLGFGLATQGWMMYAVIAFGLLGGAAQAAMQSIVSNAADPTRQGQTMGAVSSLSSLMAVFAPVVALELLRWVSHRPAGDWLIGLPFFVCSALAADGRHRRLAILSRPQGIARPARLTAQRPASTHVARQDPHPRLRLPGHAADRAARARGARVLRDPPQRRERRVHPRVRAQGHHPVGQPRQHLRGAGAARPRGRVAARRAGARHLLRHVHDDGAARRRGRGQQPSRVRLCRGARAWPHQAVRRHRRLSHHRGPRHAQGVDEPRRQGDRAAAGLQADGQHAELPDRRHGRRGARLLRRAVPSRGHAHAAGPRDARALRARHLRRQGRLDHARPHRRGGGAHPRAGGRRGGHARPVGWRRFQCGRGADSPRDRRAADLRVRRPRPAAPERRRTGDGDVRRPPARQGAARRCQRAVSRRAERRRRPRGQTQDHRPRVRRGVPARGQEAGQGQVAGAGHDLPRRHRIGRRQDQEGHHDQEPPQRGRPARDAWA